MNIAVTAAARCARGGSFDEHAVIANAVTMHAMLVFMSQRDSSSLVEDSWRNVYAGELEVRPHLRSPLGREIATLRTTAKDLTYMARCSFAGFRPRRH